jgi:hypothetical protein
VNEDGIQMVPAGSRVFSPSKKKLDTGYVKGAQHDPTVRGPEEAVLLCWVVLAGQRAPS